MVYAIEGDTTRPVYGSDDDPEFKQEIYKDIDDSYTGYATVYPEYVRPIKSRKTIRIKAFADTYNLAPTVLVMPDTTSWIDGYKNRNAIRAWLLIAMGLFVVLIGLIVVNKLIWNSSLPLAKNVKKIQN